MTVTDLSFNNMDFLSRQDHLKVHERSRKSREKEQRKISKDLQEEADFFYYRDSRRARLAEIRDSSRETRSDSSKSSAKLRGAELQRLKISLDKARPSSAPLRAQGTSPCLPSLPRASRSDTSYISWPTSPLSTRRRRQEPTESAREPTTSNSPVAPSAIKRLIRTGVFDFAKRSEHSVETILSGSQQRENQQPNASPEPQYADKGVMNSPWAMNPQNEDLGSSRQHEVSLHAPAGLDSTTPLLPHMGMTTDENTPTFHQLQPASHQNAQIKNIGSSCPNYWTGPRLPKMLPSLAEISQELSDTQHLGQHWVNGEPDASHLYADNYREGLMDQPQLTCEVEWLHDAHAREEPITAFIARLEAEVLGRNHEPAEQGPLELHEPSHGTYIEVDQWQVPGQVVRGAQHPVRPWNQGDQGQADTRSYDETEMTAFWRPNRFL